MGDPKRSRRKYETPNHPWEGDRIKEEQELVRKYGLKNKREVWKARSTLRSIRGQARHLQGLQRLEDPQVKVEARNLLSRLRRIGMVDENAGLDDVLALNVEAVLVRRLQTLAYLKGLASTPKQARQLIVHGHVSVDGSRCTIPGMLVTRNQEVAIQYANGSPLGNEEHPVRPKLLTPEEQQKRLKETLEKRQEEDQRGGRGGRGGPGGRRGGPGGGRGGPGGGRGGPGGRGGGSAGGRGGGSAGGRGGGSAGGRGGGQGGSSGNKSGGES